MMLFVFVKEMQMFLSRWKLNNYIPELLGFSARYCVTIYGEKLQGLTVFAVIQGVHDGY